MAKYVALFVVALLAMGMATSGMTFLDDYNNFKFLSGYSTDHNVPSSSLNFYTTDYSTYQISTSFGASYEGLSNVIAGTIFDRNTGLINNGFDYSVL